MPAYPKAAPPSRVVRGEELQDLFRAVKGAFHDLVSSSCTSGKNGTRGGRWEPAQPPPRNHSSSLKGSGRSGGFHTSPTFSVARESIAVISGSGSDNVTTPKGGNAAGSSSPERESSPSALLRQFHRLRSAWRGRSSTWGSPYSDPQTTSDSTGCRATPGAGTNAGSRQRDSAMFDITESITQLRDGHVPTRRTWTIHESFLSVLNAQTRESVIVTVLRRQETTTPRNAQVIRHL